MASFNLPVATYQNPMLPSLQQNPLLQLLMTYLNQNQQAYADARQANESRYMDILDLLGGARTRALGNLDNLSGQEVADAEKNYRDKRNTLMGDLADRGLSGSTKRIPIEAMTQRERDAAVNRIKDTLALNRNATDQGYTDRATGVMERRTDTYPNTSNLGNVITELASRIGWGMQPQSGVSMPTSPFGRYDPRTGRTAPLPGLAGAANGSSLKANADAAQAAANEQARRDGMVALYQAMQHGGNGANMDMDSALTNLMRQGFAQYSPSASVPQVQAVRTRTSYSDMPAGIYSGNNSSAPTPQYSGGYGSPYANRMNQISADRQAGMLANVDMNQGAPSRPDASMDSLGTMAGIYNLIGSGAAGAVATPLISQFRSYFGI